MSIFLLSKSCSCRKNLHILHFEKHLVLSFMQLEVLNFMYHKATTDDDDDYYL